MIEKILNFLFDKRVIVNCDRDPYLHRWFVIRRERLALFIHKFVRSDEDRALHDHPWSFIVIPIWRGYIEHSDREDPETGERVAVKKRVYPIIGTRFRPAEYRHRVELLKKDTPWWLHWKEGAEKKELPSWSLFFRFTKRRLWGFHLPSGFMPWNKWWQDKCE